MVERADIEAKAKEIETALAETRESVQNTAVMAAVAVVVVVVAVAYFLGNRKGKAGKTLVEVYRVK